MVEKQSKPCFSAMAPDYEAAPQFIPSTKKMLLYE